MVFTWNVYVGSKYHPEIKSVSPDPRVFKIAPYFFDVSVEYKIVAFVKLVDSFGRILGSSSSAAVINIGESGIIALIAGGAYQTIGSSTSNVKDGLFIDASASYSIDYPRSQRNPPSANVPQLTFSWQCRKLEPDFGSACSEFLLPSAAILTLRTPAGSLFSITTSVSCLISSYHLSSMNDNRDTFVQATYNFSVYVSSSTGQKSSASMVS